MPSPAARRTAAPESRPRWPFKLVHAAARNGARHHHFRLAYCQHRIHHAGLVITYGWRSAWAAIGAICGVWSSAFYTFLLTIRQPEDVSLLPDNAPKPLPGTIAKVELPGHWPGSSHLGFVAAGIHRPMRLVSGRVAEPAYRAVPTGRGYSRRSR